MVAQCHWFGGEARLAALRLVMAEHVRSEVALASFGAGGLVESDLLRRHQQARDGIDECRFARADVAGEQRVVAAEVQPPDLLVEGAPVDNFDGVQAHAWPGVRAGAPHARGGGGWAFDLGRLPASPASASPACLA